MRGHRRISILYTVVTPPVTSGEDLVLRGGEQMDEIAEGLSWLIVYLV